MAKSHHNIISLVELAASNKGVTRGDFLMPCEIAFGLIEDVCYDESIKINKKTATRLLDALEKTFEPLREERPKGSIPAKRTVKAIINQHIDTSPPTKIKEGKVYQGLLAYNAASKAGKLGY